MIHQNISDIKKELGPVKLVVVSKYRSLEELQEVYQTGHRLFGENRVQELRDKQLALPKDIEWHMIGHLQKNKVKYIAPFIALIHSVDSIALLKEINKQAAKHNREIPVLLQMHIAQEDTKFGLDRSELDELLGSEDLKQSTNVKIVGLMGMASNTTDQEQVAKEFQALKTLFDELKSGSYPQTEMKELSMGMSGDYMLAKNAGSTMVRIGSKVFN